jgi:organic hydroperoxide reductase OsmC/OhrA
MTSSGHVHRYRTELTWEGSTAEGYDHFDRTHRVATVPATVDLELASDPAFRGDPTKLNPEELLLLAASSCQLLSFLAVAARARLDVVSYRDHAVGEMPEDDKPVRITNIALHPQVVVALDLPPDALSEIDRRQKTERVERLLHVAHKECYIANSLRTDITIEAAITFITASDALR